MKNNKFWNIGLPLFLLMATIVGCSSPSNSGSSTSSDPSGASSSSSTDSTQQSTSSDSSASTDSTQQSTSPPQDLNWHYRGDGVYIGLAGEASIKSSDEEKTVIEVRENGEVRYFSYSDGSKLPIDIVGENAAITVFPSDSPVSQETSKTSYASSIWKEPTFVNVSASADLIAITMGSCPKRMFEKWSFNALTRPALKYGLTVQTPLKRTQEAQTVPESSSVDFPLLASLGAKSRSD
jgi:hypothetical protein